MRAEAFAVTGLVLAGGALRLFDLEHLPSGIHGDESGFGLIALSILRGSGPHPFGTAFLDDPALAMYVKVPFLAIFGPSIGSVRAASAIAGTLTVLALYGVARGMFGPLVALLAAAFLVGSAVHIHFSRLGINFAEVPFYTSLSLACVWRGYRTGQGIWWLLGGMLGGLAFYFHFAARSFLLVLALFLLYLLLKQPKCWRQWVKSAVLLGIGVGMALAPLVVHSGRPRDMLLSHPTSRVIFYNWEALTQQYRSTAPAEILWRQVERNVQGFVRGGDSSTFYPFADAPLLNGVVAPLTSVGLALVALRFASPRYALLFIWFWTMLIVGGVLTTGPPQFHRLLPAIPPALIAAALTLSHLATLGIRLGGAPTRPVFAAAAGLVALAAGVIDVGASFGRFAETYPWADTTGAARFIAELGPEYQVYVVALPHFDATHSTIQLVGGQGRAVELSNPSDQLSPPPLRRPLAFVVFEPRKDWLTLLQARYPGGMVVPIERPPGRVLNTAYLVPADAAMPRWANAEGLTFALTADGATGPSATGVDWAIAFRNLRARVPRSVREYRASWHGSLLVPRGGDYAFELDTDGDAVVVVNGRQVAGTPPGNRVARTASGNVGLETGGHSIAIEYRSSQGPGVVELRWRPPGGARELVPPSALRP